MNKTYLHSFNIDLLSSQAESGTSDGNKIWYLEHPITKPSHMHYTVGLINFSMPLNFYDIRSTNNTFDITLDFLGIEYTANIIIPDGNYKADTMATTLTALLIAEAPNLNNTNITVSVDSSKGKFLFTCSQAPTFINIETGAYRQLGFNTGINTFSTISFNTLNMFDWSSSPALFIRLHNKGLSNRNSNNNYGGILSMIPVKAYPNEYIFYHETNPQFFKMSNEIIKELQISILDENFNDLADLNGAEFRITLCINYMYNHEVIREPIDKTKDENFLENEQKEEEEEPKKRRGRKKKNKKE